MRIPFPSGTTLGSMAGTALEARSAASRSPALVANLPMAWRLRMVGKMISISPARWRARASSGEIHTSAIVSPASCAAIWPGGAAATKNRVS